MQIRYESDVVQHCTDPLERKKKKKKRALLCAALFPTCRNITDIKLQTDTCFMLLHVVIRSNSETISSRVW